MDTYGCIPPCPADIKYALIGTAVGVAILAVFLVLKICMIKKHLFDIDFSDLRSPNPGFNGKGAATSGSIPPCPDQDSPGSLRRQGPHHSGNLAREILTDWVGKKRRGLSVSLSISPPSLFSLYFSIPKNQISWRKLGKGGELALD